MGTTTRAKATTATKATSKAKKPMAAAKPSLPVRQPRQRRASQPVPEPEPEPEVSRLLLSVEHAAVALSIGQRILYPLLMRGEIRSVTIGRRRLVPVAEIEAYIARLNPVEAPEVEEPIERRLKRLEDRLDVLMRRFGG